MYMQDKSLKQKISIYTYWKLSEAGSSNSYRTPHHKHWSVVWIFERLHDCTTLLFWKKKISCINLACQTSKLETWDSIFTSRNSKCLCFETQGLSVKLLLRYCIFIFQSFKVCECYTGWFLILVIQLYLCLSIFVICFVLILRWLAKGSFNTIQGYH